MKKTIIMAYIALFAAFLLPLVKLSQLNTQSPPEPETVGEKETSAAEQGVQAVPGTAPAPERIRLLADGEIRETDMHEYITGVVAAEMPADFPEEALKAQAVAARSYAMYCALEGKHGSAQVCSDFNCCQAFIDQEQMHAVWGEHFDENYEKVSAAVAATEGEYLSYEGKPVFAAFHSSSSGRTEDCGEVWNPRPYLISVESPEDEKSVPNFISSLECAPLDFRDCVLSAFPEANFTGDEAEWIGTVSRDTGGRVAFAELGGVRIKGTELRELFSLRSAAFELEYRGGKFIFTVRGFGHGVGMSQYGAKLMAENGADYAAILAHYYPGTALTA